MRISIITATCNAAATITHCLESVNSQTIAVEHLIIDGASTDGTPDIVSRLSPHSRRLVSNAPPTTTPVTTPFTGILSEPDRGIYDAMNKGLALATGDVVGILNADDFYAGPEVLAKVAAAFADPEVEACYGDLVYVKGPGPSDDGNGFKVVRYWRSGAYDPDSFYWGWMPPHPTFFVRRSVYEKFGLFRLDMGSAADYELMLRFLFRHRITAFYIPEVLVKMRAGGVSNATLANRLRANRMDRLAWSVNGLTPYPWTLLLKPLRKLPQFLK